MGRRAFDDLGQTSLESTNSGFGTPDGYVLSPKSWFRYMQELVLILGMQILFRASLWMRRWNY
jgi:hypothetical protein